MFVATYEEGWLEATVLRLTQNEHYHELLPGEELNLETSTGQSFRHFLDFMWSETCRGSAFTRSEVATREIEHTCLTLLLLASEEHSQEREGRELETGSSRMERAEEYIRANLTEPFALDKLIEITGTSASTLLRDFRKRYGMPPMRYLKHCRLEAARHELRSAAREETSVTDVAMRYGFYHLGRFAAQYKETFGELPSATLSRSR